MFLEQVVFGNGERVDLGDAAGGGREVGCVTQGAARQLFFEDEGIRESFGSRVYVVWLWDDTGGGE